MFTLAKKPTYLWPVKFQEPVSGGKFEKRSFDALFRRLPQSRLKDLIAGVEGYTDVDFCKEIVAGWEGIRDEEGSPIPFNEESLGEMLEIAGVAKAIAESYFESIAGDRARQKN